MNAGSSTSHSNLFYDTKTGYVARFVFLLSKCTKFVGILRKGVLMVTVYIASPYTLGEELAASDIPFKRSGS